jgi:ferredoxin
MTPNGSARDGASVLDEQGLASLLTTLRARGYRLVGPTVSSGAIVYAEIEGAHDLPRGIGDEQDAGRYRLVERGDDARFGYAVGPHSWKQELLPPVVRLWRARRSDDGFELIDDDGDAPGPTAFIGVRSCDLHAIAIQDRVLLGGAFADADYASRRADVFVVAVNCGQAASTCFCVSMDTGPRAERGYDLALTELLDGEHRFLVETGSSAGASVLAAVPSRPAVLADLEAAQAASQHAADQQVRTLETAGLRERLQASYEDPRWDEVADRCLTCGNCTLVCPTCFCTSIQDTTDLTGDIAERERRWDSCFGVYYSHINGGSVRRAGAARYRQWLTHKLSTWHDQFDTSGCVGCGRCIAWCPVGIDITEEAAAVGAPRKEGPA